MKIILFCIGIIFFLLACTCSLFAQKNSTNFKAPCLTVKQLQRLHLPEIRIIKVEDQEDPVPHMAVLGIIGKEIRFELLMPQEWNGRFAMGGGGGFVGQVQNSAAYTLAKGFATVGTDTGHQGSGHRATWAKNNIERQLNFGYMAIHRTAIVAKEVIRQYYCQLPSYSYFIGCSRGGGQAMMEAQRYPGDFDGIIAGAPAFTWPALGAEFLQNTKAIYPNQLNRPLLTRTDLQLLEKLVLRQCDKMDGIEDAILNDPRRCKINFAVFPVCPSVKNDNCFTQDQLEAIRTIYDGPEKDGRKIYPGFPCGGESQPGGWFPWITGLPSDSAAFDRTSLEYRYGTEVFKYFVFHDSSWDYRTYNFDHFYQDTEWASSFLDATSTDYSKFQKEGSKMIIYHGWNDPALSALSTIDHYEKANEKDSSLTDYIRLFLLPGVLHCGGGKGPGQADWLSYIQNWVEKGVAPDSVLVSKKEDQRSLMTRPVFPYPYKAQYKGQGDPNEADSFHRVLAGAEDK